MKDCLVHIYVGQPCPYKFKATLGKYCTCTAKSVFTAINFLQNRLIKTRQFFYYLCMINLFHSTKLCEAPSKHLSVCFSSELRLPLLQIWLHQGMIINFSISLFNLSYENYQLIFNFFYKIICWHGEVFNCSCSIDCWLRFQHFLHWLQARI